MPDESLDATRFATHAGAGAASAAENARPMRMGAASKQGKHLEDVEVASSNTPKGKKMGAKHGGDDDTGESSSSKGMCIVADF